MTNPIKSWRNRNVHNRFLYKSVQVVSFYKDRQDYFQYDSTKGKSEIPTDLQTGVSSVVIREGSFAVSQVTSPWFWKRVNHPPLKQEISGRESCIKLFYNYFLLSYDFLNWNVIQNSFPLNPTFVLSIFIVSIFSHTIALLLPLCSTDLYWLGQPLPSKIGPQAADQGFATRHCRWSPASWNHPDHR